MKTKHFLSFFIFLLVSTTMYAQEHITQNVFGKVWDGQSKGFIEGANIVLKGSDFEKGTSTDATGSFLLDEIPVGRYDIFITHVGYESLVLKDQLVESGKEKSLQIELKTAASQLEEVTISETRGRREEWGTASMYSFDLEQSQRFAATFYDPGRMALSFPGVTSVNDQANNISIRGNAPYTNKWRLEGANIVNPNHLTNAGTLSDRASVFGGGTTILSAQVMNETQLLTGAYPARYGDVLGGVLDIGLRKGNPRQREHTIQAGLLGIDLATEGPFNESKSTYLVNYRYSTIGLLQSMGVEVSDETINFQDLSFHLSLPEKKSSDWTIFGIIGLSNEKFKAERDSTLWEEEEDRIDTDFSSNMGAFGITHKISLNDKTSLKTVAAISKIQTERTAAFLNDSYTPSPYQIDQHDQGILSVNSTLHHKMQNGQGLSAGIIYNRNFFDLKSEEADIPAEELETLVDNGGGYNVYKAFGEWTIPFGKIRTRLGIHALYFELSKNISVEPRAGVEYFAGRRSQFSFNYGLVSQSHFPQVYFVTPAGQNFPNQDLDLTRSHQLNLTYSYHLNVNTLFKVESFYQYHFNVPVSADPSGTFSLLNAVDTFIDEELVNEGTGENMGIELLVNRNFVNGYYFMASSTLYDAKYKARDNVERSSRFDGEYIFSFTGGKEFPLTNKGKNRIFGINLRVFWQGGYRHTPIDLEASEIAGRTVYDESEAFSLKYKDFFRTDLRVYFKRNKEKYTRTLSFDIQNLTARKNVGFEYYDSLLDKVVTKEQLGLLPFITYRIEF